MLSCPVTRCTAQAEAAGRPHTAGCEVIVGVCLFWVLLLQSPEDALGPACPSVDQRARPEPEDGAVCKTEPNQTVLLGLDWNCVNPPTPQDVEGDGAGLDTLCKTEPAATVTLLSGWASENQNTLQVWGDLILNPT